MDSDRPTTPPAPSEVRRNPRSGEVDADRSDTDSILKHALELPDEVRRQYLDDRCASDTGLRAMVDGLLQSADSEAPLFKAGSSVPAEVWQALASLPILVQQWGEDAAITQRAQRVIAETRR